jgi:signal transduction histidine kinase
MELLDLSVLLVDTLDEYEGTLRSNMVAIERDIPPGIQLRAGAEDLRRMLVNLLSNAEDATREKQLAGVAVHLSLRETAEAVEIRVSDQGVGMSAQVIADAFTPLFSTKGFGIGLGLTIVKELAERNGGTVTLSSEEGRGTTALLRFSREPART